MSTPKATAEHLQQSLDHMLAELSGKAASEQPPIEVYQALPLPSHLEQSHPDWRLARLQALEILIQRAQRADKRAKEYPSDENQSHAARQWGALSAFRFSNLSPLADPLHENHAEWVNERKARIEVRQSELEPLPIPTIDEVADEFDAIFGRKPKSASNSIQILADVGITAAPMSPVENFTDIWCIFCDRDQIDFIGTSRNESRVEIALTLHAAFATMIRMSKFSDEVLVDSGINLHDPGLETLATFLNERTNDHYSFGPYETSIDERLFNFLQ